MTLDDIHLKEFREARAAGYRFSYDELLAAIEKLPDRQKQAVKLHYVENYNITETAAQMKVSRQRVKTLIDAAQVKLAALLNAPHTGNIT